MNKAQTVKANSIVRQLAEKHPDKTIRINPNIVTNSIGGKMATLIIQEGYRIKYGQINLNDTIKKNLLALAAKI